MLFIMSLFGYILAKLLLVFCYFVAVLILEICDMMHFSNLCLALPVFLFTVTTLCIAVFLVMSVYNYGITANTFKFEAPYNIVRPV